VAVTTRFPQYGRSVFWEAINCGQDVVSRENRGGAEVDVVTALDVRLVRSRQNVDRRDRPRPREKRETERLAHSSAPRGSVRARAKIAVMSNMLTNLATAWS
jgi:hypothetical protein